MGRRIEDGKVEEGRKGKKSKKKLNGMKKRRNGGGNRMKNVNRCGKKGK